jgi:hypothetical protein
MTRVIISLLFNNIYTIKTIKFNFNYYSIFFTCPYKRERDIQMKQNEKDINPREEGDEGK